MEVIVVLIASTAVLGAAIGIVLCLPRHTRPVGKSIAFYSAVAFTFAIGYVVVAVKAPNRRVQAKGLAAPSIASPATKIAQATAVSGPCRVTNIQFLQLRTGMSYSSVKQVIGCPGTELSRTELAGFTTVMFTWRGQGSLGANMNVMFQNDSLVSKAQFGLQ